MTFNIVPPSVDDETPAPLRADMRNLGSTGLMQSNGYLREDYLPELSGPEGARIFKEMGESDPVCGGILYAIEMLSRGATWRVEAASSREDDQEAADFLQSCMDDMGQTWLDTISEIMTMVQYGFSLHEIVYKRRCGQAQEKYMRSRYSDGRIGWRGLPIRSQDTLTRWFFDLSGDITGVEQNAPPRNMPVNLPMSKCILFRTSTHKNSPTGKSIFRPSYRPWYMKKNIEAIEAIGIERDLAGLPAVWVPPEILSADATDEQRALLGRLQDIVKNIRQDEQAGVIMPLQYDDQGHQLYDLKLMSSGGSRQFDVDKVIQRYDHRIALSAMADFLLMGQSSSSTGSFAMHSDKTGLFGRAVNAHLDIIANSFDEAIAKLFHLNSFNVSEYPRIVHDSIEAVDVAKLGDYIQKLAGAGMPLFPNPTLEGFLYEVAGIPRPTDGEAAVSVSQRVERPAGIAGDIEDVIDDSSLEDTPESDAKVLQSLSDGVDPIAQMALRN